MTSTQQAAQNFPARSYLRRFFEEKDLAEKTFEITNTAGTFHAIPNAVVVEHIALTSGNEKAKIESILRRIDFANGDINDFLAHLAGAIAEQSNF